MEIEECTHVHTEDGVCTGCGLCTTDAPLAREAPCHRSTGTSCFLPIRYAVRDKLRALKSTIQKILVPLGMCGYESAILREMGCVKFDIRLNSEDKVLVVLYHVLREEGFPVALDDLLRFSRLGRCRFLKAHRECFSFLEETREYLEAIYWRTAEFVKKYGMLPEVPVDGFLEVRKRHLSSGASDVCLAAMLTMRKRPVALKQLSLMPRSYNERIRRIMKKMENG